MSMDEHMGLAGRVVAVAGGGGGGIGTAICGMLAQAGASVAVLDVRQEGLDAADSVLEGTPGRHAKILCDVRHPAAVEAALDEAAGLGPLHGLVHVAGGLWPPQWSPLVSLDLDAFDQVLDLNLRAALITS